MELIKRINTRNIQKCPNCKNIIVKKVENNGEYSEFQDIYCEKCEFFIFILCIFCKRELYFKKNNIDLPLNGMNGINIKCTYSNCGKYFYLTICPKCKCSQKIPKAIKEGEIIKCLIKECDYEYLQIRCPKKDCFDLAYFSRPKNHSNNPSGIIYNHKKEEVFQKISCFFCIKPIIYLSNKIKINRYYDAMEIKCPYKDCQKKFNRIVCPICSEINIITNEYDFKNYFMGYLMGHKIKCIGCKNYFGKILCPKCLRINPLTKSFFISGEMTCRYIECSQKSIIVNCIFCQRMNIFNKTIPIPGQTIICGYEDCKKEFNEVYCPSCNKLNPFKGDFSFGKSYECLYSFCKKNFLFSVCPNCFSYSFSLEKQEGKKYKCSKCNLSLCNWKCPFCKKIIMDKNSSLEYGQMVRCPNSECQKIYSFCRCFECQKLIFSEHQYILGTLITCPNKKFDKFRKNQIDTCEKSQVNVVCPNCNTKIYFIDKLEDIENGEKIVCSKCEKLFEFIKKDGNKIDENDIYSKNLSVLESIQGEPINFGNSCVDENYLSIENLYIQNKSDSEDKKENNSQENQIKKKDKLCIICHCNLKESVFYPCGHKSTCYECAVYYFEIFKKCPKCKKDAEAYIPKVYEQFSEIQKNEKDN